MARACVINNFPLGLSKEDCEEMIKKKVRETKRKVNERKCEVFRRETWSEP